ncbi:MAG TPA: hypothetical protein VF553_00455 [Pyrinomonadaceae bacterium]|jgi:hypothetical protein
MSINSLTDAELRQSPDYRALRNALPARAVQARAEGKPGTADTEAEGEKNVSNALSQLVKYIPTETITLYVAAISAATALKTIGITELGIYWFFAVLTPLLVVLIYLGKRKAAGLPVIPPLADWPWWKTIAATIAYLVWALAVPNNPYVKGDGQGAIAGFFAIFISTLLSVLEQIFDPPAKTSRVEGQDPV